MAQPSNKKYEPTEKTTNTVQEIKPSVNALVNNSFPTNKMPRNKQLTNHKGGKPIPIVVCEFHQEVIQFIHRYIARKRLNFDGIKMVHLDSHPDLAFPHDLKADDCFNKELLYDNVDIADWILPLMYEGHVKYLTWVHPPWANQIQDGVNTNFCIGKEKNTGQLKVNCKEDYFLEDSMFTRESDMENQKEVQLLVSTLESLLTKYGPQSLSIVEEKSDEPCSKRIKTNREHSCLPNAGDRFILDIDLDFFAVTNPFLQDYTEEEHKELKEIYKLDLPSDKTNEVELMEFTKKSQDKLDSLKRTIQKFADGNKLDTNDDNDRFISLLKKIKQRKGNTETIDWDLVHSAGMTTELPHHISSESEVDNLLLTLEKLIKIMPTPSLVTIARSAIDEYCPPNQVDDIERRVMDLLKNVYSDVDIHLDYMDDTRVL